MSYPDIVVAGAGTASANGTYEYLNMYGGKPQYKLVGAVAYEGIRWAAAEWAIRNLMGIVIYRSFDNVDTPDLATTWYRANSGIDPPPTVTAAVLVTPTPACRVYTIPAENRTYTIISGGDGNEVTTVESGDAGIPLGFALLYLYSGVSSITVTGTPDDRTYVIPADDRTYTIPAC